MKSADEIIAECKLEIDNAFDLDRGKTVGFACTPFQYEKHPDYKEISANNAQYTCPRIIDKVTKHLDKFQTLLNNEKSSPQAINEEYRDLHRKISDYEYSFNRLIALIPGNEYLQEQFSSLKKRLTELSAAYTEKTGVQSEQNFKGLKRKYSEITMDKIERPTHQEAALPQNERIGVQWTLNGGKPFAKMRYEFKPIYSPREKQQEIKELSFTTELKEKTLNSILIKFTEVEFANKFAQELGVELAGYNESEQTGLLQKDPKCNVIAIEQIRKFCRIDVFLRILERYAPDSQAYFSTYFELPSPTEDDVKQALSELLIKKVDLPKLKHRNYHAIYPDLKEGEMRSLQRKFANELLNQTFQVTEAVALFKVFDKDNNLAKYFCETLLQGLESLQNLKQQLSEVSSLVPDMEREMRKAKWQSQYEQFAEALQNIIGRIDSDDPELQSLIDKMARFNLAQPEIPPASMDIEEDEEPPTKRPRLT